MTGGFEKFAATATKREVEEYSEQQHLRTLPSLQYEHENHGCAGYYNDAGKLVQ